MKRIILMSFLLLVICSIGFATEYLGDFAEDQTVYWMFATYDANGALAAPTAKDVSVLRLDDKIRITTGVTADMNSTVGKHIITIDTSADPCYQTGHDYAIDVNCTVDGYASGGVCQFSIENRPATIDANTAARVAAENAAAIAVLNAAKPPGRWGGRE